MSQEARRFDVRAVDDPTLERIVAEAWAAGSTGVEERDGVARIYAVAGTVDAVRAAVIASIGEAAVGPVETVAHVDWSEAWKEGLTAQRISERLVVRPPFVAHAREPGQREIVIEPGQAFGTGAHASTRLALEWIDALVAGEVASVELPRRARVLDVGTGSGVLAMAVALLSREARVVGVDLDDVAIAEARPTLAANALDDRIELRVGSLDALRPGERFDLAVANLLHQELRPLLADLARCVAPGGLLVVSGLLTSESTPVEQALGRVGFFTIGSRSEADPSLEEGAEANDWISLLARRA